MNNKYSQTQEKELLKSKQLIKKYRFIVLLFTFLPFLLEDWLNEMQQKGYILYSMKNRIFFFSFIFEKSNKSVSYSVDVRNGVDDSYFELHEGCGWQLMYTPVIKNSGYSVWMRINEGERQADFFSDRESKIAPTKTGVKIYLWGVAAFWGVAIVMIAIGMIANLGSTYMSYCYTFLGVSLVDTIPVPFVLSFYSHKGKKDDSIAITQRSFSRRLFFANILTFVGTLVIFIISTILTATTHTLTDGTKETYLLSTHPIINAIQIGLIIAILASILLLFITIPYLIAKHSQVGVS